MGFQSKRLLAKADDWNNLFKLSRKSRFLSDNCTCQPQSDIYLLLLYALELVSFPGESLALHCIEISTALAFAFTAFFVFEQQEIDGLAKFLMTTRSNE
ncbi:hypothetical protein WN944_016096 [Citrus x changshan-huyou]|uniref:Uncharacterized protein n=1 Tax=Citrus x changshan-huyou TaxID=2935761 RepID=A0AAP0MA91_9ROSI